MHQIQVLLLELSGISIYRIFWSAVGWIHGCGTSGYGGLTVSLPRDHFLILLFLLPFWWPHPPPFVWLFMCNIWDAIWNRSYVKILFWFQPFWSVLPFPTSCSCVSTLLLIQAYLVLLSILLLLFAEIASFYKLKVCGNPASSKSIYQHHFSNRFAHSVSLSHILVILNIFQTFSILLHLLWWWPAISDLWCYYYNLLKAQMMVSIF